ncbi:hypothetical protein [Nonomuraea dietziae]|uniref:hypothetical protein n=1 Tax=Nonomuraea dietziae TaxID=65515 RepID=UPI0031DEA3CD
MPHFLAIGAPKGRHHCPARRAPRASRTSPVAGQGAQVLPHRRAASLPRRRPGDAQTYREHVWRRADYEALFDDAPEGALLGEATPFYLYDLDAQRRMRETVPGRGSSRSSATRSSGRTPTGPHLWSAGLEPIGRRGAGVRRGGAQDLGGMGALLALHRARPVRRAARPPVHAVPARAGPGLQVPGPGGQARGDLDRICAFLGVEQGPRLTHAPRRT